MKNNPIDNPFELPFQRWQVYCQSKSPITLLPHPSNPGATSGTTLAGAFTQALTTSACQVANRATAFGHCLQNPSATQNQFCQQPDHCPVAKLCKPYSAIHQLKLTEPVLLHSHELELNARNTRFVLELLLWGQRPLRYTALIEQALTKMAQQGLKKGMRTIPFSITKISKAPAQTLQDVISPLQQLPPRNALLFFEVPYIVLEKNWRDEQGKTHRRYYLGQKPPLPLAKMLGLCAKALATWHFEDLELGDSLPKSERIERAKYFQQQAEESAAGIRIDHQQTGPARLGLRTSATPDTPASKHSYPVDGFVGMVDISGDLLPALPWLVALGLAGGGQRRDKGFGRVRIAYTF